MKPNIISVAALFALAVLSASASAQDAPQAQPTTQPAAPTSMPVAPSLADYKGKPFDSNSRRLKNAGNYPASSASVS